jgi:hypothetical protein
VRLRARWWLLPCVLLTATVAWFALLAWAYQVPPRIGQDPYGYFDLARSLSLGRGFRFGPPSEDLVPSFAPGYPALLAALFEAVGPRADLARALTLGIAAACPLLLLVVVRRGWVRFEGRERKGELALTAGAFLASCPLLARASFTLMSDGLTVAVLLAAALCSVELLKAPTVTRGVLLATVASCAFAVRYAAAPVALFVVVLSAVSVARRAQTRVTGPLTALAATFAMATLLFVVFVGWGALAEHPVGSRWSPFHAFASFADTADGRLDWGMPLVLAYAVDLLRPGIAGPALVAVAARGAWTGPRPLVGLSLGWVAVSMAIVLGLPEHNTRFWLLSCPAFAVLGAVGVGQLERRVYRLAASLVVIAVGLVGSAREARRMGGQAAVEEHRVDLVETALNERGSERVFTLGLSPAVTAHVPSAEVWEAYSTSDVDWDAALSREGPCLLLLEDRAAAQWQGTAAWRRVERATARASERRRTAGGAMALDLDCGRP